MLLVSDEQIREYTERGWWGSDTVVDLLLRNVQSTSDAVAVVDPPNRAELVGGVPIRLTYDELRQAMNRLAGRLLDAGIKKDDVVMVQLPNIVELVCVYLAAARIGAIVSPLPVQYRTHELQQVMKITEPTAFVTTTNFGGFNFVKMVRAMQPEFPSLMTILAIGQDLPEGVLSLQELLTSPCDEETLQAYLTEHPTSANEVFTVCWTSGTEAEPKGVARSHNHWIAIAYASVDGCELDPGTNLLNPFPLINMAAIGGMLVPWLLTGGKLALHHPLSLPVFLGQIQAEKINYTVVPPALLNMLLQNPAILASTDISSIKNIGSGAAPLSPWMVTQYQEKYGIHVINMFGSNEGASFTSGPKDIPDPAERAQYFPRFGVPGYEWASRMAGMMSTKLVDPVSKEIIAEPGIPGEMAIKGAAIFSGYYKRPDLTQRAFDDEGYFYTGDLFEIAGDGDNLNRYRFVSRLKEIIIRGGMNISSQEIEALIIEHPKVAEVAVVGYADERLGEKVCAVVALKKDQSITLGEIVEFLKAKDVAVYKLPERLVVVDSLPRNPVGKVLKRVLQETVQELT
ncbi:MAG: AMP-binding protein [Ardenticatenaceae bacterium]|nr:AMP-binding protein [Ardenticatenaceae bacterium]HBY95411.1 2,3-dihydroxybenzoate-AMP ligase [Chloroflexota bacterium]